VKRQFKVTFKNKNPETEEVKSTSNIVHEEHLISAKPVSTNIRSPAVLSSSAVSDPHSLMPLELGSVLTIISLGTIDYARPDFHTERYIYPIGYKSQRQYKSYVDPNNKTSYTCEILDGGTGPIFKVTPADDPNTEFSSSTPTGCCTPMVKKVNQAQASGKRSTTSVSGPEFFGFSNPRVMQLIEMLPNADKCERYARKYTGEKAVLLESAQILGVQASPARKKGKADKEEGSKKRKNENKDETKKKRRKSKKGDAEGVDVTSGSESESKRNEIIEQHKQTQKDILQMPDSMLDNAEEYDEELLAGISKPKPASGN
jgi:hypothetical protein